MQVHLWAAQRGELGGAHSGPAREGGNAAKSAAGSRDSRCERIPRETELGRPVPLRVYEGARQEPSVAGAERVPRDWGGGAPLSPVKKPSPWRDPQALAPSLGGLRILVFSTVSPGPEPACLVCAGHQFSLQRSRSIPTPLKLQAERGHFSFLPALFSQRKRGAVNGKCLGKEEGTRPPAPGDAARPGGSGGCKPAGRPGGAGIEPRRERLGELASPGLASRYQGDRHRVDSLQASLGWPTGNFLGLCDRMPGAHRIALVSGTCRFEGPRLPAMRC
ncbi:uncharacterized protein LOC129538684 [Moschus berezovskii]|uniref:uncharacterized protein LOC129538684 n=1 Tax=Moschus berezovskii TaxID=68408 RepID=UPI00244472F2|nr:uncharacterized protein LOC129538684 [Moschus berezovskii]